MTTPLETSVKTPLELAFTIERASELQPVGSPCTDVCRLDKITGYCEGCFRSREEIKAWKTLPDADKLGLFPALLARKAAA
jgi:predicted Fe-S protein YdhL (DUF1289 family)